MGVNAPSVYVGKGSHGPDSLVPMSHFRGLGMRLVPRFTVHGKSLNTRLGKWRDRGGRSDGRIERGINELAWFGSVC